MTVYRPDIECLFGPDGVGKSTIAEQRKARNPGLVVLHGTRVGSWPAGHCDYFETGLLAPFEGDDTDFDSKIDYVTASARSLALNGVRVVIDGHALHKTTINKWAGLMLAYDGSEERPDLSRLFETEVSGRMQALAEGGLTVVHTRVTLPHGYAGISVGEELQRRMSARPEGRSRWDPDNANLSAEQMAMAGALTVQLHRHDFTVSEAVSELRSA